MMDESVINDDKLFLAKEITPSIARLTDRVQEMLSQKHTIRQIYDYILDNTKDYSERYIVLFLFGMAYQNQNENLVIHLRK